MSEIVQKSEFAKRANVGKSAVSNWIAAGQLTREPGGGLVMRGKREMVDVAAAVERLNLRLDPSQSLANGAVRREALRQDAQPEGAVPPLAPEEPDDYRSAKTEQAKLAAARGRLSLERERGAWVSRDDAAAETRKAVAALLAELTTAIEQEVPRIVAAEMGLAPAAIRAAIRAAWRECRTTVADRARTEAQDRDARTLAPSDREDA